VLNSGAIEEPLVLCRLFGGLRNAWELVKSVVLLPCWKKILVGQRTPTWDVWKNLRNITITFFL